MAKIRLSKAAETDLDQIARFGIDTFGSVAARRYRDGLKLQLARIEEAPLRPASTTSGPDIAEAFSKATRSTFGSMTPAFSLSVYLGDKIRETCLRDDRRDIRTRATMTVP
jgi:plasmid stabilization system protein ParE